MNTKVSKQIENVLEKLDSARKLEKDILEKGLTCVDEHVQNVDSDWLDIWFEKDTYLKQVINKPIYSRKDINKFLRVNFYTKNVNDVIKYSFQNLIDAHWFVCKEKQVKYEDYVLREENTGEIYAIYPLLDCGEKLVWISILHKFGNLCFAHDRLTVFSVLRFLSYNSVKEVVEEYNISAETLRKVFMEYSL